MDISTLPNIVLDTSFANRLGLASVAGLARMVDEGTLPNPSHRRTDKPVWSESHIIQFFGQLQATQSAYAPVDRGGGQSELDLLESYVCPALSSGHIGTRRPTFLALYKAGAPRNSEGFYEMGVYPVQWVQTQKGVAGETIATPVGVDTASIQPVPWDDVRPDSEYPLTVFKLDVSAERTITVKTGVRRGGTISTASLQRALNDPMRRSIHFKGGEAHLID